jgi:DNA-binding MurR/RpiR family transcriptional regulator
MLKDLSFDLVAPKFRMPILEAAKQIGVSKSTLHRWCKLNGIKRWPYRKIRSMEMLVSNVKVVLNHHFQILLSNMI